MAASDSTAIAGKEYLPYSRLLCSKIRLISTSQYKGKWVIQKICLVNEQLWCARVDAICIYYTNGELLREIKHKKLHKILSIIQAIPGKIIVACSFGKGLHQLNTDGMYVQQIAKGSFSDSSFLKDDLYTLEDKMIKIVVFKLNENKWMPIKEIKLDYISGFPYDCICVQHMGIFVSSCISHRFYKYDLESGILKNQCGEFGKELAGQVNWAGLSSVDNEGKALIQDRWNKRLQIWDTVTGLWHILTIPGLTGSPTHCLLDGRYLWLSTEEQLLLKFELCSEEMELCHK